MTPRYRYPLIQYVVGFLVSPSLLLLTVTVFLFFQATFRSSVRSEIIWLPLIVIGILLPGVLAKRLPFPWIQLGRGIGWGIVLLGVPLLFQLLLLTLGP